MHVTSMQPNHLMEDGLHVDVVVRQITAILELYASEAQMLLIWGKGILSLSLVLALTFSMDTLDWTLGVMSPTSHGFHKALPVLYLCK